MEYFKCDICEMAINPDNEYSYCMTDKGACVCRACEDRIDEFDLGEKYE